MSSPCCSVAVCCRPFLLHTLFPGILIQKHSGSFISLLLMTWNQPETAGAQEKEIPAPKPVPVGCGAGPADQDLQARMEIKWRRWL